MYWLDGILLVGIGIGALLGARSGFLQQFGRIAGVAAAFYTAFVANDWATQLLLDYALIDTEEHVARFLSYLIVFFGVYLAIFWSTRLVQRLIQAVQLDSLDRLLGALVGGVKMTLLMAVLCLGLVHFPHPKSQEVVAKSVIAPALVNGLELVAQAIPDYYHNQFHKGVESIQQTLTRGGNENAQGKKL